jgi:hypothetical protein
LVGLEIAGLTTLLLRSGVDLDATSMQKARGWTDEEWNTEADRLIDRGLLDGARRITPAGADLLNRAEALTNRLALSAIDGLDDAGVREVGKALVPLASAVASLFPYPNPIGMPTSWDPAGDPDAAAIAEHPGA